MSTTTMSKIAIIILCAIISLSICSCTGPGMGNVMQEVNNITNFAGEVVDLTSSLSDPTITEEQLIAKAEGLIHPDSDLTLEGFLNELKENEKMQEIGSAQNVEVVKMPELSDLASMIQYSEELGGNVYNTEVELSVDGVPFIIGITLFSNENGMGIYGYNIQ